jgi:hypothetical protein
MKRSRKPIQKFLLIFFSAFLLLQPVLEEPQAIAEIAIFYLAPAFEVAHWEALFAQDRQSNYQELLNVSFLMSVSIAGPFSQISHHAFSAFTPRQQSISLRC